jgi:hypothetical protein
MRRVIYIQVSMLTEECCYCLRQGREGVTQLASVAVAADIIARSKV